MFQMPRVLSSATVLKGSFGLLGLVAIVWALQQDVKSPSLFRASGIPSDYSWSSYTTPASCNAHCATLGKVCGESYCSGRPNPFNTGSPTINGGVIQYQNDGTVLSFSNCGHAYTGFNATTQHLDCCCGTQLQPLEINIPEPRAVVDSDTGYQVYIFSITVHNPNAVEGSMNAIDIDPEIHSFSWHRPSLYRSLSDPSCNQWGPIRCGGIGIPGNQTKTIDIAIRDGGPCGTNVLTIAMQYNPIDTTVTNSSVETRNVYYTVLCPSSSSSSSSSSIQSSSQQSSSSSSRSSSSSSSSSSSTPDTGGTYACDSEWGSFCNAPGSDRYCCEYPVVLTPIADYPPRSCISYSGGYPSGIYGTEVTCTRMLPSCGSTCGNNVCEPGEIEYANGYAPNHGSPLRDDSHGPPGYYPDEYRPPVFPISSAASYRYRSTCDRDCGSTYAFSSSSAASTMCGNGLCEKGEIDFNGTSAPGSTACTADCARTYTTVQTRSCPSSSSSSCPARDPDAFCPVANLYCPFGYAEIERECEFDSRGCPWSPVCAPAPSSSSSRSSLSSSFHSSSSSFSSSSSSSSSTSLSSTSTGAPIGTVSSFSSSFPSSSSGSSPLSSSFASSSSSFASSSDSSSSSSRSSSSFSLSSSSSSFPFVCCCNESGTTCAKTSYDYCATTTGLRVSYFWLCSASSSRSSSRSSVSAVCGNGVLDGGEQCESGIRCPNNGFCTVACICEQRGQATPCGNGVLNIREDCDDGNTQNGDGCDALCRREGTTLQQKCGNTFLEGDEQCELSVPCSRPEDLCRNCQCLATAMPACGDGTVEFDEECETMVSCADPTFVCTNCRCIPPACGDGSRTSGEECDDGNTVSGDGCSSSCQREIPNFIAALMICGNGLTEQGEECDDGNVIDGDGCSVACEHEVSFIEKLRLSLTPEHAETVSVPMLVSSSASIRATGPTPKKAPSVLPSVPREPLRAAAVSSASFAPSTSFPVAATVTQQVALQNAAYGRTEISVVPFNPSSGPVGKTGPASLAIMAAGAAAGFAFMRRKRRG